VLGDVVVGDVVPDGVVPEGIGRPFHWVFVGRCVTRWSCSATT
jgi:hypothetical protein